MAIPPARESAWVVAGRSATGGGHLRRSVGCDDHHLVVAHSKCVYLAVADGAGSAAHATVGAQGAVFCAIDWLAANTLIPHEPHGLKQLERCFIAVHSRLKRIARAQSYEVNDLATTLLVAVVGPWGVLAGQIGDGALVIETDESMEIVLQDRKTGAVNKSAFVTDSNYRETLRIIQRRKRIHGAVAVTDGVEGLTISRVGGVNEPFFRGVLHSVRDATPDDRTAVLERLLESTAIRDSCDDDLTIAAAALKGET